MTGKFILTAAAYIDDADDADHMAVCIGWVEGWRPSQWRGAFVTGAQYVDATGNVFRVMSCPVGVSFIGRAGGGLELERPPEDVPPYVVNMTGAQRAHDKLVTWMSINDVPEIRDIFGRFDLIPVETSYTVGSKGAKRVCELVVKSKL